MTIKVITNVDYHVTGDIKKMAPNGDMVTSLSHVIPSKMVRKLALAIGDSIQYDVVYKDHPTVSNVIVIK